MSKNPFTDNFDDILVDIDSLIEELDKRIPGLMVGPECPLDQLSPKACSCTYKTGCLALKNKDNEIKGL